MSKYTTSKSVYVGFLHTESAAVCQHFRLIFSNIGWGGKYSERPHRFWYCWNRSERAGSSACKCDCQGQTQTPCREKETCTGQRPLVSAEMLHHLNTPKVCMKSWKRIRFCIIWIYSIRFYIIFYCQCTMRLGLALVRDDTLSTSCTERGATATSNSHLPLTPVQPHTGDGAVCNDRQFINKA